MSVVAVPGSWSYSSLSDVEIRWFWIKTPFSLKAVYQLDVPHRKEILRFCDTDNARMERSYGHAQTGWPLHIVGSLFQPSC